MAAAIGLQSITFNLYCTADFTRNLSGLSSQIFVDIGVPQGMSNLSWTFEIQTCFPQNDLVSEFDARLLKFWKTALNSGNIWCLEYSGRRFP